MNRKTLRFIPTQLSMYLVLSGFRIAPVMFAKYL